MPTGCLQPDQIGDFLAGRLEPAGEERIEEHLDACDDCRVLVGEAARDSLGATAAGDSEAGPTLAEPIGRAAGRPRRSLGPSAGSLVGRYLIRRTLGAGGMGVVLLAEDPELRRNVVIKLLRAEMVDQDEVGDVQTRLLREAQAMAKVSHPNVVPIYDVGLHDGRVFLAMEYVDGEDLASWLRSERPWREVVAAFVSAGRGLAAAHRVGIVHRDFKPQNVMVARDGTVKVTDFGLARAEPDPDGHSQIDRSAPLDSTLTRTGAMLGTPAYMAPEQMRSEVADARSDQFSFCVALFEALYGRRPFPGATVAELFESTLSGAMGEPPVRSRRLPKSVRRALRRGLAVEPAARFPSMDQLLEVIEPRAGRRTALVAAIAAVALTGSGVAWWKLAAGPPDPCGGAAAELSAVWNPARRRAIERAFGQIGTPMARGSLAAALGTLDRYTRDWIAGQREACQATRVRGAESEQQMGLRMGCLRRRRHELDAVLALLEKPDDAVVERASGLVLALESPAGCRNLEALGASSPMPADPTVARKVLALQAEVARSEADLSAQRHDPARARLLELLARAEPLGYRPLVAEIEHALGTVALSKADLDEAEARFRRAVEAADRSGHDRIRALAYSHLVEIATTRGKLDEALLQADQARATIERLGNDPFLAGNLDLGVGEVYKAKGDLDRAEAVYRRALEEMTAAHGAVSHQAALVHTSLGLLFIDRRATDRAFEEMRIAREIWTEVLGANTPEVQLAVSMMSTIRFQEQRFDEAVALAREDLALSRAYYGDDHPMLGGPYGELARALQGQDKKDEAIAMMKKSVELQGRMVGTDHPYYAGTLVTYGYVLLESERFDAAFEQFSLALAIFQKAYGEEHKDVVDVVNIMGVTRHRQKRLAQALGLFERALKIAEKINEPGSEVIADTLTRIGAVENDRGKRRRAVELLEKALAMREASKAEAYSFGWTRHELASALWNAGGDRARAIELARAAREDTIKAGDKKRQDKIDAWLAKHRR